MPTSPDASHDAKLSEDSARDAGTVGSFFVREGIDEEWAGPFVPNANTVSIPLHTTGLDGPSNALRVSEERPHFRLLRGLSSLRPHLAETFVADENQLEKDWFLLMDGGTQSPGDRAVIEKVYFDEGVLRIQSRTDSVDALCASPTARARSQRLVAIDGTLLSSEVTRVALHHTQRAVPCLQVVEQDQALVDLQLHHEWLRSRSGWQNDLPVPAFLATSIVDQVLDATTIREIMPRALRLLVLQFPLGGVGLHSGENDLDERFPDGARNPTGLCLHPRGDGFVVTLRPSSTNLPIAQGDEIVAVNFETGKRLYQTALEQAQSKNSVANVSAARFQAARSALLNLPLGSILHVRKLDGEMRRARFTTEESSPMDCTVDWTGLPSSADVDVRNLGSGVGVIRVRRWYPSDASSYPDSESVFLAMRSRLLAAFQSLKSQVHAIVWDVRGNPGGLTPLVVEVVSGMQGARSATIARCQARVSTSEPLEMSDFYVEYSIEPGGDFAFDGPSAILIDGHSSGANNYFALAARRATDAVILGAEGDGTFGTHAPIREFSSFGVALTLNSDSARCEDASGSALEGRRLVPDLLIELEPTDVARGQDTMIAESMRKLRTMFTPD